MRLGLPTEPTGARAAGSERTLSTPLKLGYVPRSKRTQSCGC
jgi:hypothetical protein